MCIYAASTQKFTIQQRCISFGRFFFFQFFCRVTFRHIPLASSPTFAPPCTIKIHHLGSYRWAALESSLVFPRQVMRVFDPFPGRRRIRWNSSYAENLQRTGMKSDGLKESGFRSSPEDTDHLIGRDILWGCSSQSQNNMSHMSSMKFQCGSNVVPWGSALLQEPLPPEEVPQLPSRPREGLHFPHFSSNSFEEIHRRYRRNLDFEISCVQNLNIVVHVLHHVTSGQIAMNVLRRVVENGYFFPFGFLSLVCERS